MISPSLQEDVSILIFSKVIQKNKNFKKVFQEKVSNLSKQMGFKVDIQLNQGINYQHTIFQTDN